MPNGLIFMPGLSLALARMPFLSGQSLFNCYLQVVELNRRGGPFGRRSARLSSERMHEE